MSNNKDWLRVIFVRMSNEPEALPVSFVEACGEYAIGILEMEPHQQFGCHKGDKVKFFPFTDDEGKTVLICDMNIARTFCKKDLEDGTILKEAITTFNNERNERNLLEVLQLLRDSDVWVPCTAVLSDADQKRLEEVVAGLNGDFGKLAGEQFVTYDETRLIPDILQNGDLLFFPVFTAEAEMGEYGANFSKVGKQFLETLTLAKNNDKDLAGIVVNAFTEPFVLDKDLWEAIENMKSRLSE